MRRRLAASHRRCRLLDTWATSAAVCATTAGVDHASLLAIFGAEVTPGVADGVAVGIVSGGAENESRITYKLIIES